MSEKGAAHEVPRAAAGRRGLILAAAMMATFMTAVETTIVATAMPTIVADLGDFHLFSWVFAAYLLAQAVSIPIYGRLADLYGRKRIFFVGAGVFLVGSTLCGFAHGMLSLIAFRALQGIGAGAVQPVAYTIVGDIYSPTERARVQGFLSSVFGFAAVVGPTLGAFLVEHADWSIVFWINLPVGALAIAMLAAFYHETPHSRPPRIDYLASILLMVGGGALMMAMIQGGSLSPWMLAACLTVGVGALAGLVRRERHTEAPMLPFRLWRSSIIALANLGSFAIGAVMISVSAFLPIYVQGVMGRGAATTGAVLGAMSISWAAASIVAGRVMLRTSYRVSALIGGAALPRRARRRGRTVDGAAAAPGPRYGRDHDAYRSDGVSPPERSCRGRADRARGPRPGDPAAACAQPRHPAGREAVRPPQLRTVKAPTVRPPTLPGSARWPWRPVWNGRPARPRRRR